LIDNHIQSMLACNNPLIDDLHGNLTFDAVFAQPQIVL